MSCVIEFEKGLKFNFAQNKYKQRLWLEVLINFNGFKIYQLASILDLPINRLIRVYQGVDYLKIGEAHRLGQLFLIVFGD